MARLDAASSQRGPRARRPGRSSSSDGPVSRRESATVGGHAAVSVRLLPRQPDPARVAHELASPASTSGAATCDGRLRPGHARPLDQAGRRLGPELDHLLPAPGDRVARRSAAGRPAGPRGAPCRSPPARRGSPGSARPARLAASSASRSRCGTSSGFRPRSVSSRRQDVAVEAARPRSGRCPRCPRRAGRPAPPARTMRRPAASSRSTSWHIASTAAGLWP